MHSDPWKGLPRGTSDVSLTDRPGITSYFHFTDEKAPPLFLQISGKPFSQRLKWELDPSPVPSGAPRHKGRALFPAVSSAWCS